MMRPAYDGAQDYDYMRQLEKYADNLEEKIATMVDSQGYLPDFPEDDDCEDDYEYSRPELNDKQTRLVMDYFCERINDSLTSLRELIDESE